MKVGSSWRDRRWSTPARLGWIAFVSASVGFSLSLLTGALARRLDAPASARGKLLPDLPEAKARLPASGSAPLSWFPMSGPGGAGTPQGCGGVVPQNIAHMPLRSAGLLC